MALENGNGFRTQFFQLSVMVLLAFLLVKSCEQQPPPETTTNPELVQRFRNLDSSMTAFQKATLAGDEAIKAQIWQMQSKISKPQASITTQIVTTLPGKDVEIRDTLKDTNVISVPKKFGYGDKWFSIGGTIKKTGIQFDPPKIYHDFQMNIGLKEPANWKEAILRPREPYAEIITKNPYDSVAKMTTLIKPDKRRWYEKRGFWFGAGTLIGAGGTVYFLSR